jgi:predicted lipoprotein with Yx(FWY)xxD motif
VLLAVGAGSAFAAVRSAGVTHRDGAVVKLRQTGLGRVLVDGRGRTLYLFEADKGPRSHCYGKCATFWPPLLTHGKPLAGAGARAALLGEVKRKGGSLQVTYHGHPLYFFAKDERAGQNFGQGVDAFGGEWYTLDRSGTKVEPHEASTSDDGSTTTTGTSSGGYGGGYG